MPVQDERHFADALDRAQQAESVEMRHRVIRKHEIDGLGLEACERFGAVHRAQHREAGVAERLADALARRSLVLGEQDAGARRHGSSGPVCGSSTRKTVRPGADATAIEPPCADTTSRHSASPSPKP